MISVSTSAATWSLPSWASRPGFGATEAGPSATCSRAIAGTLPALERLRSWLETKHCQAAALAKMTGGQCPQAATTGQHPDQSYSYARLGLRSWKLGFAPRGRSEEHRTQVCVIQAAPSTPVHAPLTQQQGPVFICGIALTSTRSSTCSTRLFLLRIDAHKQKERLLAYDTSHPLGRNEAGRQQIRVGRPVFEAQMLKLGAIALDGTAPTHTVADRLLALVASE